MKLWVTGATIFFAVSAILPIGGAVEMAGAIVMIIGAILLWIEKRA